MTKTELDAAFDRSGLQRPEDAIGVLLWRVAHRYQREIDRASAEVDLTHLQFVVLVIAAWLGRKPDPVTQTSLSDFSGIHKMLLSDNQDENGATDKMRMPPVPVSKGGRSPTEAPAPAAARSR